MAQNQLPAQRGSRLWDTAFRVLGLAAGAVAVGILGLSALFGYRSARPRRSFGSGEPPDGVFEPVLFPSADGLQLSGWFFPAGHSGPGVVICHGFQTGRREGLSLVLSLQERGHNVLVFDFRAHGESEGRWSSCGLLETRDLEGAVCYLAARPEVAGHRVGVLGFSMGAAVSILTAAQLPEIAVVVADSPFATFRGVLASGFRVIWGLPAFPLANLSVWFAERLVGVCADDNRPLDAIAAISPRPILIVHGESDRLIPVSEAYLLHDAAGEPKELWTVPGADHVEARLRLPYSYLDRIDAFLTRWISDPAEPPAPSQGYAS